MSNSIQLQKTTVSNIYNKLVELTTSSNNEMVIIQKSEDNGSFEVKFGDTWNGFKYLLIYVFKDGNGVLVQTETYGKLMRNKTPIPMLQRKSANKFSQQVLDYLKETVEVKQKTEEENVIEVQEENKEVFSEAIKQENNKNKSRISIIGFLFFLSISIFLIVLHVDHNEVMMKRYGDNLGELYQEPLSFFDYLIFSLTLYFLYLVIKTNSKS